MTLKQRLSEAELAAKLPEIDGSLQAFLSDGETDTKIISGEDISTLAGPDVQKLKEYLEAKCDTKVIVYVRNLYEFLDSTVQELVKNGVALSDIEMALKQGRQVALPRYRSKIETFVNVFGRENVNVRTFDRERFRDGDLLADFCDAIDFPDLAASLVHTQANTSVSEPAVGILNKYNELFPLKIGKQYNAARTERFQNYFNGMGGPRFRVTDPAWLDDYETLTADDRAFLQDYLGEEDAVPLIKRRASEDANPGSMNSTVDVNFLFHALGKILLDLETYEKALEISLAGLSDDAPEEEASDQIRNGLKYITSDDVCRRLSVAFLRRNKLRHATITMKRALNLSPDNAKNHILLGEVYQQREKWDKAEEAFRQAVALDETNAAAYRKWSGALAKLDRPEEARNAAQRAVELSPDKQGYRRHLRLLSVIAPRETAVPSESTR